MFNLVLMLLFVRVSSENVGIVCLVCVRRVSCWGNLRLLVPVNLLLTYSERFITFAAHFLVELIV